MPSIKITEVDSTSAGSVITAQDVVFVPGFVNAMYLDTETYSDIADAYLPILCETVSDFEFYFGEIPAAFVGAQKYPAGFTDSDHPEIVPTGNMFAEGDLDPGYVYAKELLNAGIPVYYERVNETSDDISVAHMYDVLAELTDVEIWDDMKDVGEYYEVKYLTSGGYPTFEYYNAGKLKPVCTDITLSSFTQATFEANATVKAETGDVTCLFTYGYLAANAIKVKNAAALEECKETATEDELYYVIADEKLYKIVIPTDPSATRSWEEVDYSYWTLTFNGAVQTSAAALAKFGIELADTPIIGSSILITLIKTHYSIIATKMLDCAASRGDCVALIDHTNNNARPLDPNSTKSVYYSITSTNSTYRISSNGEFGTMFTPWCGYTYATTLQTVATKDVTNPPTYMPGSFGYLMALSKSIQTNANWLAIAGAARGVVNITKPNLIGTLRLSNAIADEYQPRDGIAINPITKIKPYGYLIWGNRTLKNNAIEGNLTATSFLNIRNMVSDIKKMAYMAARRCMFEQNSDVLWINYKARVSPLLDRLVSGNGLSGYKFIKGTTTEKAKLVCTIRIYPIYAVESFDITVELADDEVTIS